MKHKPQLDPERAAEEEALLTLLLTRHIGPARISTLRAEWGCGRKILQKAAIMLAESSNPQPWLESLCSPGPMLRARTLLQLLPRLDISLLSIGRPGYPQKLTQLPQAPPLLFYRGAFDFQQPGVLAAVVGTRTPTPYGRRVAEEFASGLAAAGITVVSGLARGIDSHAHHATLQAGGKTIAVLAGGLDRIYPPERASMAEEICQQGLILSEMPPGTKLIPGLFPRRNRIISGLSDLVIVVEGSRRSGALITAGQALDQGREVAAVPGPIHSSMSRGPLELIRDGAVIADSVETLLELLGRVPTSIKEKDRKEHPFITALTRAGGKLEEAANIAGLEIQTALSLVTRLELEGKVLQEGTGLYLPASPAGN